MEVPDYADLPVIEATGERHAWEAFGPADELGCLNFLTAERVASAAALVSTGESVSLNLPIGQPKSLFWTTSRKEFALQHEIIVTRRNRDDYLNNFFLQGSTQWDGFPHVRYREFGYYGGRDDAALDDRGEIGIDRWAERGIFGRGVLIDTVAYRQANGQDVDPTARYAVDAELIEAILAHQRTVIEPGDVLILRTGWLEWYMALTDADLENLGRQFETDRASLNWPGLDAGLPTVAWLWDHQVAAVAADNPTLEAIRYLPEAGWAHHRLLALLGMPLGELWKVDRLAESCQREGRHHFFLSSAPLNLPRGVGSPANAYAIF